MKISQKNNQFLYHFLGLCLDWISDVSNLKYENKMLESSPASRKWDALLVPNGLGFVDLNALYFSCDRIKIAENWSKIRPHFYIQRTLHIMFSWMNIDLNLYCVASDQPLSMEYHTNIIIITIITSIFISHQRNT